MAIHNQPEQEGNSGFQKKFEAGAEAMLFDFVQSAQYQFPVRSAIREITSNSIDSIREKQRFFDINSGKAKVEDFYIHREGEMYKDSNYNPDYYDERWLSKTENRVKLIYKANGNSQRDTLHIIDTGVGLGGLRMEKHFNPLFSTKRNNNHDLGKYGIGSKAGLALEVDYYTLISRYNGKEFHYNVYAYKVDPTVPRMNTTKGVENPYYEMETSEETLSDGTVRPRRIYYHETDKPNGVEVILQAKKGLRKEFIDAIKGQLLYLEGIDFEIHENGEVITEQVKAAVDYEDEIFVLANASSTYYSKPHIILNGICYGYINFLQMEEEDRAGNIGIKVSPDKIDINPNRESVRWTEKTTKAIHEVFKQGEQIAAKILSESLQSTDLIDWIKKCSVAIGGADTTSVVGRFSNIVNLKDIQPKFTPLPKIQFNHDPRRFFTGYEAWTVTPEQKYSRTTGTYRAGLTRTKTTFWGELSNRQIFYQDADTTFRQEMFMLTLYPAGFVKIIPKGAGFKKDVELTKDEVTLLDITYEEWKKLPLEDQEKRTEARLKQWESERKLMDDLIKASSHVDLYSSVEVPDHFKTTSKDDEEEEEEAIAEVVDKLTPEEKRKLENKIVVHSFYNHYGRTKEEIRIKEILQSKDTIIYGFGEDEANLGIVSELILGQYKESGFTPVNDSGYRIVMVSQANAKYFKPHIYVDDFFMKFNPETKTISMHNKLVQWQTARKINDMLPQLEFLNNFRLFDAQAHIAYCELIDYRDTHFTDLHGTLAKHKGGEDGAREMVESIKSFADQLTELQLFVATHPGNLAGIAAMSKALFETTDDSHFSNAMGIELDVYQKLLTLLDLARPVGILLNRVSNLTSSLSIDYQLEMEIKDYLKHKGYLSLSKLTSSVPTPPVQEDELMEVIN